MQPTPPAWYLDPFGRPQTWRWWDGRYWTRELSADPYAAPPVSTATPPDELDGRYHSGPLSCRALPWPWEPAPAYLELDEETGQQRVVGRSGRGPYIACVFLGRLPERFGYDGGHELAAVGKEYAEHLLTTYYPHETREGASETDHTVVGGRPAWQLVVDMHIDDPTLAFEREQVAVVLVDLEDGPPGVVYASLPEVDGVPSLAEVLDDLAVGAPG